MDNHLIHHIEALIFISRNSISSNEIKDTIEATFDIKITYGEIERYIEELIEKYSSDYFAFEISKIGNGYKMITKGAYYDTIGTFLKQTSRKRLSKAALETLSIIAYKQPVTKSELEKIRGVSCDYSIQKLLEKELVEISGRTNGPGRPLIYRTSDKFMNYFGLSDLDALPKMKDFNQPDEEIGESAPIEESIQWEQKLEEE